MRDKPKDDLHYGNGKNNGKNESAENPAAPEHAAPTPPAGSEDYRVKDQFRDIENIPSMTRDAPRTARSAVPGGGLSDNARPGRSIRRE